MKPRKLRKMMNRPGNDPACSAFTEHMELNLCRAMNEIMDTKTYQSANLDALCSHKEYRFDDSPLRVQFRIKPVASDAQPDWTDDEILAWYRALEFKGIVHALRSDNTREDLIAAILCSTKAEWRGSSFRLLSPNYDYWGHIAMKPLTATDMWAEVMCMVRLLIHNNIYMDWSGSILDSQDIPLSSWEERTKGMAWLSETIAVNPSFCEERIRTLIEARGIQGELRELTLELLDEVLDYGTKARDMDEGYPMDDCSNAVLWEDDDAEGWLELLDELLNSSGEEVQCQTDFYELEGNKVIKWSDKHLLEQRLRIRMTTARWLEMIVEQRKLQLSIDFPELTKETGTAGATGIA